MINTNKYFFILLVLLSSLRLAAQTNDAEVHLTLLKGTVFTDTINSHFAPFILPSLNCNVSNVQSAGSKKYRFDISPNETEYVGEASVSIQYTELKPPFTFLPKYTTYYINYVESIVKTEPDFVSIGGETTVTIFPMANDYSSLGDLSLGGLGQVQYGTALVVGDSIMYNSMEDTNDYIVYNAQDSLGTYATGLIFILKEEAEANVADTLRYTITNTNYQFIILPFEGFALESTSLPSKGITSMVHPQVYKYTPNQGATGEDSFLFVDDDGNSRLILIQIIDKVQNTSSVRDDKFYTPKNTTITFDVFANDLSSNFAISNFSSELSHDTLGIFNYTPSTGFQGEKYFTYEVNYGGYKATAKITVVVGNYQPQTSLEYDFTTLKNTSVALEYAVPVNGYTFNLLNAPLYGSVEILDEATTLNIDCNEVNAKATIVYTPDTNYYGGDEFDVEYCIVDQPCIVYKISIDVADSEQDSLCNCVGADCVWSGDLNGDGRVSVADLLPLGRYLGYSGPDRADMVYGFWNGQHGDNWSFNQVNGKNAKYIDADGDGLLTTADTAAISQQYTAIHTLVPDEVLGIKDYPFLLIPNSTELDSGDLLVIDIAIGNSANPVSDIFGLAFGLNFPPNIIDSTTLVGQFDTDGWFGRTSPSLQMVKQPSDGKVHMAFTRTGGQGVSGKGKIGQLSFIVEDEIDGFKTGDKYITYRIHTSGIEMETGAGERYTLPDSYVNVRVNIDKSTPVPSEDKLLVFPNPASDVVQLHFNGRNMIKGYKMFDIMGQTVSQKNNIDIQSMSIPTLGLANGIYMLQVLTSEGIITKKIEVVK